MEAASLIGRVVTIAFPDPGDGRNPPLVGTVTAFDAEDQVLTVSCTTTGMHDSGHVVHVAMQGLALTVHEQIGW